MLRRSTLLSRPVASGLYAATLVSASVCPAAVAALFGSTLGCASSADRQDPLKMELEHVRKDQANRGPVQCRPGTQGPCFTGPANAAGRGICKEGVHTCAQDGYWEVCKGEVMPKARELCNGLDDDCDGAIDNGFARIGTVCEVGVGECKVAGVYVCRADGTHADCSVRPRDPSREVCDGKDNDCNGKVDDAAAIDAANRCDTGRPGVCKQGQQRCVAGEVHCIPDIDASHEVCNKIDDDCDGTIDEACVPEK